MIAVFMQNSGFQSGGRSPLEGEELSGVGSGFSWNSEKMNWFVILFCFFFQWNDHNYSVFVVWMWRIWLHDRGMDGGTEEL